MPHVFIFGKFSARMCVHRYFTVPIFNIIRVSEICFGLLKVEARMITMDRSFLTKVSRKFLMVLWSRSFGKG